MDRATEPLFREISLDIQRGRSTGETQSEIELRYEGISWNFPQRLQMYVCSQFHRRRG